MYAAAQAGDLARVRHHIQEGVNPDYQHPEVLCTPLVAALIHGHRDIARYLLAQGASATLRSDFDDLTPLQAARRHGHGDIADWLVAHGAVEVRPPWWQRWLRG